MKNVIFKGESTKPTAVCKPSVSYIGLRLEGDANGHVLLSKGDEWVAADGVAIKFNANGEHGVVLRIERTAGGDFVIEQAGEV